MDDEARRRFERIAARDTYEFHAPGVRAPHRLRAINEIQHRLFSALEEAFEH